MSSSKDILENLQKAVDFMDCHPVAIALAMTPSFKSRLPITHEFISSSGSYSGLKTYIWSDLPEPYRIYYNQAFLEKDIALYNN